MLEIIQNNFESDSYMLSISDPTNIEELRPAIAALHIYQPIDAVITQLEPVVDVVARVCAELGVPFTNADAVERARDKAGARAILCQAGLRSARHKLVSTAEAAAEAAETIGGPVIVKPRTAYDSLLAYPAKTPEEARQAARKLLEGIEKTAPELHAQLKKGILVEEWLIGPLVSAEIGVRDGRFYRFMLSGRPRSRENECIEMGASMPAALSPDERHLCFQYAEDVIRALGLDLGIFHIELILTADGPVLVEANPRLMGGVMPGMYRHLTGDDIAQHLVNLHLGLPIDCPTITADDFITSRKLMPRADAILPDQLDLQWVAGVKDLIAFEPYLISPRRPVRAHDILARYQIRRPTLEQADAAADSLLDRFEAVLGIPLIH